MSASPPTPFAGLALRGRLSANLVGFCRLLRAGGSGVGPGEESDALRALDCMGLTDAESFRLALRLTLAKTPREQELFDRLFAPYWMVWERAHQLRRPPPPEEERERPPTQKTSFTSVSEWLKQGRETEEEREEAAYSPLEVLGRRDLAEVGAANLEELGRLVAAIARALAARQSRRWHPARRRGRLDLRRTLRASLRRGGELVDLAFRRRRPQRLKLVVLCDVSRSMDLYSRFLVHFLYAFQRACRRIETFAFSTSLQRITPALRRGRLSEALTELSHLVPGWSGGTRIGFCLDAFLRQWGDALLDRNTAVLIASDGWDTGEAELLAGSMQQVRRRCRCLLWLNPLMGSPDYRPEVRGMSAALPFIDVFAPAHNVESLRQLARYLERIQHQGRLRRNPFPTGGRERGQEQGVSPVEGPSAAFWRQRFGVSP